MPQQTFNQHQGLHQQQTIGTQMQQSLEMLQTPTLELRKIIQQELSINPALEDETHDVSLEEVTSPEEDDELDRELAELSQLDEEWKEYMSQSRAAAPRRDDADEKHQFMMDSIVDTPTLQEHLVNQLHLSPSIDDNLKAAAEYLIGYVDENGFLNVDLDELSEEEGLPVDRLEEARAMIQTFDPVGVGAEDLRDCLLIQLERLGKHNQIEYEIVERFLDDLAKNRLPFIAEDLDVDVEIVAEAADYIASLDPRPGSRFARDNNSYVVPDVYVEKMGRDWIISLNNEQIPHLKISRGYKEMLASDSGKKTRAYVRDKIKAGKFLIKCIHQRQETIRAIAEEIVRQQQDFLDEGPTKLKPMTMAQIADAVGVHETTVSRAVAGKYISTPHGVFDLKYFFTSGYENAEGETLSNTTVKQTLATIIANENTREPLGDKQLVKEMEKRGITIARRTIAKYRDELKIPRSHLRKTY